MRACPIPVKCTRNDGLFLLEGEIEVVFNVVFMSFRRGRRSFLRGGIFRACSIISPSCKQAALPVAGASHGNDGFSSGVTSFQIPEGLRGVDQQAAILYGRYDLAGFKERYQIIQVFLLIWFPHQDAHLPPPVIKTLSPG